MKTFITAFAALLGYTSAQNFLIINNCSTPVYFQPILSNGDASGPLDTVQSGQSWSEAYRRPDGSTVKIGTNETLDEHLSIRYQFGPSDHGEYIWCEPPLKNWFMSESF
ncbi:hypothetical protein EsDP_00002186 [Epichloe bromicola]|uniref:Uncharacterized protein n=1 Tax=Epichloe bromicola TaxID=79588 RepID=A0ABQ0CK29_9HYPO